MAAFSVTLCDGESLQPLPCVDGHYVAVPGKTFAIKAECTNGARLRVDDPHVRGGGGYCALVTELDGVSVTGAGYQGATMAQDNGWSAVHIKGLNDRHTSRPLVFGFPKYSDDARTCNADPSTVGSITVRFPKSRRNLWPMAGRQGRQFEGVRFPRNTKKDVARMVTVGTGPCVSACNSAEWTYDLPSAADKAVIVRYATAEMLEAKGILDPEKNIEHRKYFPNRNFDADAGTQPTPRAPVRMKREREETEAARNETLTTIDLTEDGATRITIVERKRRRAGQADVELE